MVVDYYSILLGYLRSFAVSIGLWTFLYCSSDRQFYKRLLPLEKLYTLKHGYVNY
jgi:hypothetical protein